MEDRDNTALVGECSDANLLAAYVDGTLSTARKGPLEHHISRCSDCRAAVAELALDLASGGMSPAQDAAGESVVGDRTLDPGARYRIESLVGRGAMGTVYRAHDVSLNRVIALKFLQAATPLSRDGAQAGAAATDALQREAQALAKLTHPNVVAVYELGVMDGKSFAAMELVQGATFSEAVRAGKLAWRQIVELLVQAGRGLAAAHSAGVIHRDVKPSNLLVGTDGRVRVVDFGLACTPAVAAMDRPVEGGAAAAASTTVTSLAGTPAYMAPELVEGAAATARSDQYSFCVAAVELLTGDRPRWAPGAASVRWDDDRLPRRLAVALRRGLTVDPARRHADMAALVAELLVCATPSRRWPMVVASVAVVVAVATTALLLFGTSGAAVLPRCDGGNAKMGAVWSRTKHDGLVATLDARVHQPVVVGTIARELDRYAASWRSAHREACLDTAVRHVQSAQLLDRRMLCLDRQLAYVNAFVAVLPELEADQLTRAAEAAARLGAPSMCAASQSLSELAPLPADPKERAAIQALSEQVARYKSWIELGRADEAAAGLAALESEVVASGYDPLLASFYLQKADLMLEREEHAAAWELLHKSLRHAEAGGDAIHKIYAANLLGGVASRRDELSEATHWVELARAAAVHAGLGNDSQLVGNFETSLGAIAWKRADYQAAFDHHTEALRSQSEDASTPTLSLLATHSNLAMTLRALGKYEESLLHARTVLQISVDSYGLEHEATAQAYFGIGATLISMSRPAEALEMSRKASAIWERSYGKENTKTIFAKINVGVALMSIGELEAAEHELAGALVVLERAEEPTTDQLSDLLVNLANVKYRQQKWVEAVDYAQRAVRVLEAAYGADHPLIANPLNVIGASEVELGQWDRASDALNRALEMQRRALGADHPQLAYAEHGLADIELRRGRYRAALERFQATERLAADDFVRAVAKLGQSQALWELPRGRGRDRPRARKLAVQAARLYEQSGQVDQQVAAALQQWQSTIGVSATIQ